MKKICIMLCLLLVTLFSARAEIQYSAVPFQRPVINMTMVDNPDYRPGDPEHLEYWNIPQRPSGGLVGHLKISKVPENCTAYLRFHTVLTKDLLPPEKEKLLEQKPWFSPLGIVKPQAPLRKIRFERSWKITADSEHIPISIPSAVQGLYCCAFEIVDGAGKTIFHETPIEIFTTKYDYDDRGGYQEYTAWIASSDETAKHRLSAQTQIHSSEIMTELPDDWRCYAGIRAMWIDEKTDISTPLLRRFILSGGWIFGNNSGLDPFSKDLGIPVNFPVLCGGMMPLEGNNDQNTRFEQPPNSFAPMRMSSRDWQYTDSATPLENNGTLFGRIKTRFLGFTFLAAGIYALGATILLPVLFFRTKGPQRLGLWWKTPLVTAVYSLLVLCIGWIIQPSAPLADVTEFRFGYSDWPEVYCNINATALRYGHHPYGWTVPTDSRTTLNNGTVSTQYHTGNKHVPGTVEYTKVHRGMQTVSSTEYFKKMNQPFSAAYKDEKIVITSQRAVRNLHLALGCDQWIDLGDLRAGKSVTVMKDSEPASIKGIPAILEAALSRTHKGIDIPLEHTKTDQPLCDNCGEIHNSSATGVKTFGDSIILIAVDEKDKPAVNGLGSKTEQQGRVAWITQVPLKGYDTNEEQL